MTTNEVRRKIKLNYICKLTSSSCVCKIPGNNGSTQVSLCSAVGIAGILLEQRFLTVKAQVNLQKGLSNVSMQREGLEYTKTIRKKYFQMKYKIYGKNMVNSVKTLNTECIINNTIKHCIWIKNRKSHQ